MYLNDLTLSPPSHFSLILFSSSFSIKNYASFHECFTSLRSKSEHREILWSRGKGETSIYVPRQKLNYRSTTVTATATATTTANECPPYVSCRTDRLLRSTSEQVAVHTLSQWNPSYFKGTHVHRRSRCLEIGVDHARHYRRGKRRRTRTYVRHHECIFSVFSGSKCTRAYVYIYRALCIASHYAWRIGPLGILERFNDADILWSFT